MRWFKHFSDANTSDSLSKLILDLGFEGYGRYWMLMEFLSYKFDGEDTEFSFHPAIIRETLRLRSWNGLETFLKRLANVRGINVEYSKKEIKISAPILFDLQDKDSKYNRSRVVKRSHKATLDKEEEIEKEEDKYSLAESVLSSSIFDDVIQLWNDTCGKEKPFKFAKGFKSTTTKKFFEIIKLNPELKKVETWKDCFESVKNSPILNGSNSTSGFVCNLGWLIDQEKIIDVLNGQYGSESNSSVSGLEAWAKENGVAV